MTDDLKKTYLGTAALEYLRLCLSSGYTLCKNLLDLPLEHGQIWTYLPVTLDKEDLEYYDAEGPLARYSIRSNVDEAVDTLILEYLQLGQLHFAVFQEVLEVQYAWLPSESHYTTYGLEVYHFLDNQCESMSEIYETRRRGYSPNSLLNVSILTSLPISNILRSGQETTDEILELLAANTRYIIVEAFDGKSDIIWCRA